MATGYTSTTEGQGCLHPDNNKSKGGRRRDPYRVNFNLLAIQTGVTLPHISRVLRGLRTPSVDLLETLAALMGVSMEELRQLIRDDMIVGTKTKDKGDCGK